MQIVLNGEPREIPDGASIVALLEHLGIDRQRVAVELNEQVVPKAKHPTTALKATDRVEIVTFVGGG
ncbi:MAG: sulfur carrier protein ThiS [Myxococcaceae bacterium]|nr:sulfur carrier protein ThiS [Myxococcaceae bacterium]